VCAEGLAQLANECFADADRLREVRQDNAQQDGGSCNLHRGVCDERGGAGDRIGHLGHGPGVHFDGYSFDGWQLADHGIGR